MLTKIEALNFRSLRYVSRPLDRFQVLVGPNGSGKSSFLDCVAFVADVLQHGPLKACQGNGAIAARSGDPAQLVWMRSGRRFEIAIELAIPAELQSRLLGGPYTVARYEVAVDVGGAEAPLGLAAESLWLIAAEREATPELQRSLFPSAPDAPETLVFEERKHKRGRRDVVRKLGSSGNDYFRAETSEWNAPFRLGPGRSALANLPDDEEKFPVGTWVKRVLQEGVQRVVLDADAMRRPSPPGSARHFLPDGSNLPWVIEALRADRSRFEGWIRHLQTALPDLVDVTTVERPEDRHSYLVVRYANGLEAPSWVVSDGTLRMLALTLFAYIPRQEGVFLIEEPENGIHPQAIETVFQSLSSIYDGQVLCASHSPIVLGLASPEQLLCFAKDEHGATDIVAGHEHPRLRSWQGTLDLGTLFASGVLG
ncbi:MAG: AAA family ATPase [Planctomycetes bacterium]|nr:AAA family ATPase [Planctomycetota bacterium]